MSDTPNPIPDPYHPTSSKFPPFIVNKPHSEKVDAEGLEEGSVMEEKADVISSLVGIKGQLPGLSLSIISFTNWASTQKRVLLYAKPTTRSEIENIVTAASQLDPPLKVSGFSFLNIV